MEAACPLLARSVRLFCRSIELCDDYLRGLYGLTVVSLFVYSKQDSAKVTPYFQVSSLLLKNSDSKGRYRDVSAAHCDEAPSKEFLAKVHTFAKKRLEDLIKARSLDSQDLGYSQSELIATKELLNRLDGSD